MPHGHQLSQAIAIQLSDQLMKFGALWIPHR